MESGHNADLASSNRQEGPLTGEQLGQKGHVYQLSEHSWQLWNSRRCDSQTWSFHHHHDICNIWALLCNEEQKIRVGASLIWLTMMTHMLTWNGQVNGKEVPTGELL